MGDLFLIAGLGNPGSEYERTRHNAGFLAVQRMAERWGVQWAQEKRFRARMAKAAYGEKRVLLCQPQTYMNASGEAIGAVASFYQVETGNLLVVVDDADLPFGEIRLRPTGSPGGHHGLESVESCLGTRDYARLRIGIGRHEGMRRLTGYVLGRFHSTEMGLLDRVLAAVADQVERWLTEGIQKAMSQFNGIISDPDNEGKEK